MGFFDPPHKKIMASAPRHFRSELSEAGSFLELVVQRVPMAGRDLFRTVVIGSLALRSASEDPSSWSNSATAYANTAVNNAYRFLPEEVRGLAMQTVAAIAARAWADDEAEG